MLTAEKVRVIRPGYGLPPKFYQDILGKIASRDIKRGTPLDFFMVERAERDFEEGDL